MVTYLLFANKSLLFARAIPHEARVIKRILSDHESTSSQIINFQKLTLSFSLNVLVSYIGAIKGIFGIEVVSKHLQYLGRPTSISHNRKDILKPIVDRVAQKVGGWKEKLFLIGGEEVLIKAVAQIVLTYTMSFFQLPEGTIVDIHRLLQNFCWGYHDSENNMHWFK